MKLLMLTHTYHPSIGGGIRYKTAIVEFFRSLGHQVDVLGVSLDRKFSILEEDGGSVIRVPLWLDANGTQVAPGYLWSYCRRAPRYDVLHFNFPSPMCEIAHVLHAHLVRRAKKVAMYHADIVPAKRGSFVYNSTVTRRFLAGMDRVIVSSPNIARSSPHLLRVPEKIRVIPFGLRPETFERPGARSQRAPGDPLRLLFVGRLSRYKGLSYLIRSMTDMLATLRIVGAGPLRSSLEQLRDQLGLEDRVHFTGRVSDDELLDEYHSTDVLVLPSTDAGEAFGYVILEAMMCGAAVVSTELGTGTSFVNEHDTSGLVVPPSDFRALRDAFGRLQSEAGLLKRLKEGALKRAHGHFTIDRMLRESEALYRELLPASLMEAP